MAKRRKRLKNRRDRFLIAMFYRDPRSREVEFKGFAFNYHHAARIIAGDEDFANAVMLFINGRTNQFRDREYRRWTPVRVDIPHNDLMLADDLITMAYTAQKLAEIKYGTGILMKAEIKKILENKNVDALVEALAKFSRNIKENPPAEEEEEFDNILDESEDL